MSLQEARTLTKARKLGVVTPALYAVNLMTNSLTFEFVEGPLVKDILLRSGPLPTSGMVVLLDTISECAVLFFLILTFLLFFFPSSFGVWRLRSDNHVDVCR